MKIKQVGQQLEISIPYPRTTYLTHIMKSNSFENLWPLFQKAHDPIKEFTESYSAYKWLKQWHDNPTTVLHIGDGAHCRTAALFAFFTKHCNISIDPQINLQFVDDWMEKENVKRLYRSKQKIEEYLRERIPANINNYLVTFVHAHVDTDEVLTQLGCGWKAAFVCPCCAPNNQKSSKYKVLHEQEDWCILSPNRSIQVLINE